VAMASASWASAFAQRDSSRQIALSLPAGPRCAARGVLVLMAFASAHPVGEASIVRSPAVAPTALRRMVPVYASLGSQVADVRRRFARMSVLDTVVA